ncbi:hypothetical protein E6P78_11070 [Streptomyces sp. A0958]|uniref:hypothetical protein n=1 Tax=Streptomyces sp. A0958 TaxID=2563101 RepID=UPI00109E819C|nr:hypothetical protein [Streptomyces sp. A0958]THA69972.1 hypothetical protein E6P78_11070 [Streptomyces sp. A0958]
MPSAKGTQFAELNANRVSALCQDLPTTPGTKLYWRLYPEEGATCVPDSPHIIGCPNAGPQADESEPGTVPQPGAVDPAAAGRTDLIPAGSSGPRGGRPGTADPVSRPAQLQEGQHDASP